MTSYLQELGDLYVARHKHGTAKMSDDDFPVWESSLKIVNRRDNHDIATPNW